MPVAKPSFPRLLRSKPLAQGLVFSLPLYEGSGTALNNLAGTNATASITDTADVTWDKGDSGYAVKCQATASTTRGVTVSGLPSGTTYTIALGFRKDTASDSYASLFTQSSNAGFFAMSTGKLNWFVATDHLSTGTVLAGTGFHNVAVAVNGTAYQFYIDGVADASGTTSGTVNLNTFDAMFNDPGSETLIGAISYLHVYNRILSASEIAALAADPFVMFRPSRTILKAAAAPAGAAKQLLSCVGCGA